MASIDDLAGEVASLGVTGLVLIFFMAVSGYAGAAALTTALATLGGPFGMLGGIGVLFLLTRISKVIAQIGIDNFAKQVMQKMIENGKSKASLLQDIDKFPLISADLREKLRQFVYEYNNQ